ncbi:hypothetical protein [Emcibacter sp. SYSU 3D8]|uniref:hypothetical protein n=1 Tax=Emcibacter sp. SYSU 3D8 TaxID=3133969 RepID=UPI0031FE87BA
MNKGWAAALGLGLMGVALSAVAQDSNRDAVNPSTPGQMNPATKPIDETFRNPIPAETERPTVSDWGGLRPDYGREETYYFCSPCHSDARIRATRKTRDEWSATIDRILDKYPYEPLEAQERDVILDYLAKQYGPNVP